MIGYTSSGQKPISVCPDRLYLGIDFGTSGARAIAIGTDGQIQVQVSQSFGTPQLGLATLWQSTLFELIARIPATIRQLIQAIAINGTSSTVLITNAAGHPLAEPILYNDDRGAAVLPQLQAIAPPHHPVLSATSSLAKLVWWQSSLSPGSAPYYSLSGQKPNVSSGAVHCAAPLETLGFCPDAVYFLHQADWLSFLLHGRLGVSDYHNALKLGYDVVQRRYPDWMPSFPQVILPQVMVPGEAIAPITSTIADQWQFPRDCMVCAGTTDSIAAFVASGAHQPGEAVTSLGSTLVLKLLSETRVDDAYYGIYSHRLGDLWLVGGASNTGGAVLQHFFTSTELEYLSQQIQPEQDSGLDYYPLLKPGERFPINDPALVPRLDPRPEDAVLFLHGLLDSMARIEAQGYRLLQEAGASPLLRVYTAGGGAKNVVWGQLRSRYLQVPVIPSPSTEAAYGTARLAMSLSL